jgi:hypothetical protein
MECESILEHQMMCMNWLGPWDCHIQLKKEKSFKNRNYFFIKIFLPLTRPRETTRATVKTRDLMVF